MDSPFVFSHEVVNDNFIGRKDELAWLSSNMAKSQHTVIIAPPNAGKKSLIRNAFFQAQKLAEIKLCTISMFNIRDVFTFYTRLTHEVLRSVCNTSSEWEDYVQRFLPLTQPLVEVSDIKQNEIQVLFTAQRLAAHYEEVLQLPEKIATERNIRLMVCFEEFQEITRFENTQDIQKKCGQAWKQQVRVGYLLTGSKINAMNELFAEKMPFYKFGENIPLQIIEEKLFVDYIIKSYSKSGRVISKEYAERLCREVSYYPYYVQQYAHLSWLNTKGFVLDSVMEHTMEDLLDYNEQRFLLITDDLSTPQINFLRAVIDGVDRFSSTETIEIYQLNSSANVTRVRGALEKKEILEFIKYKPRFIDPVFEIWFRKRYMNK